LSTDSIDGNQPLIGAAAGAAVLARWPEALVDGWLVCECGARFRAEFVHGRLPA
jgi:hypothetical protein